MQTIVLLEDQVRAIYREAEEEILAINRADAYIILLVCLAIITDHDALHIGRRAVVSDRDGTHSLVHSLQPCSPVTLATTWCAGSIAVASTIVVSTYYGILAVILTSEHNHEVVPVVLKIREVLDAGSNSLSFKYTEHLRMSTPEGG